MRSVTEKLPAGQPFVVRVIHWLNIISLFGMITSGLQIYNANPVFGGREGLHIPWLLTLGGWLAGGLGYTNLFLFAAIMATIGGLMMNFWVKEPRFHGKI